MTALKAAIKLNPGKFEARELLARVAMEERDYYTALEQFQALEKQSNYKNKAVLWNEIGVFHYREKKNLKDARSNLLKAYKLEGTNPTIVLNLAIICDKSIGTARTQKQKTAFINNANILYQRYLTLTREDSSRTTKRKAVQKRMKN